MNEHWDSVENMLNTPQYQRDARRQVKHLKVLRDTHHPLRAGNLFVTINISVALIALFVFTWTDGYYVATFLVGLVALIFGRAVCKEWATARSYDEAIRAIKKEFDL